MNEIYTENRCVDIMAGGIPDQTYKKVNFSDTRTAYAAYSIEKLKKVLPFTKPFKESFFVLFRSKSSKTFDSISLTSKLTSKECILHAFLWWRRSC